MPRRSQKPSRLGFLALRSAASGVVYGDIGTSPLYAFREAVNAAAIGGPVTRDTVLGVLSLILWALIVVVTLKYVLILLRADNNGGGRHAVADGAGRSARSDGARRSWSLLGIVGAALFYGDAVITPAISVLSAVEGLKVATPAFEPYVLPLDGGDPDRAVRRAARGTAQVAAFFGPVTWSGSSRSPSPASCTSRRSRVLAAINPAMRAIPLDHGLIGLVTLGAVFLASPAARRSTPISATSAASRSRPPGWVVLPALLLNYFGQGALVLADPEAIENPFYLLYPDWAAAADGGARDRRHRDRQPGGDHRRLFAHRAGDPARPAAALRDPSHLGGRIPARSTCRASTRCC